MVEFERMVADLKQSIERARKDEISLTVPKQGSVMDFKTQQQEHVRNAVLTGIRTVTAAANKLPGLAVMPQLMDLIKQLNQSQDLEQLGDAADDLLDLATSVELPQPASGMSIKRPKLPSEIRDDVSADLDEVQRCMDAQCYRSAVILCGRVLETALHRKYYEVTKNDLLEKSPGIGLGNLVARLAENGVKLDPALGNQIHLINQVRVHSVHQKQDAFRPSATQAQAIVLYTLDVVEKLFA